MPGRTRRPDPSTRGPESGAAGRGDGGRPRGAPAAARDPGLAGVTAPHLAAPARPPGAARPEQARARGAQGDSGLRLAPSGDPRAAPLGGHVLGPAVSSPVGPRRAQSPRSRVEAPACCGPRAPP